MNVFETFLPQLLLYPNPSDPLNGEAAALLLREPEKYKERVKEYVRKYASGDAAMQDESSNEEMSDMEMDDDDDNDGTDFFGADDDEFLS